MKTNFLKIVLPAFALMIAITASLAFTADADEITTDYNVWTQDVPGVDTNCTLVVDYDYSFPNPLNTIDCNPDDILHPVCTVNSKSAFYRTGIAETGPCNIALYKDTP
ncbi:DUF6520 family protein [Flavivirga jejuensis]|uniref:DUF6520 family protein n=1 Tax=Flavivirga jejuensis TaxID=870487 RepID=A0ABT8WVM6_9FLAO|nr:DUF6520 family protein [Flavivirga jejuensis]MDO5977064.1 DUF6520 family protein [Flavivirga jejuensis]